MADEKISQLTSYTPPLDADVVPIVDTATNTTKKVTWANIKATLKTYFDTLYGSGTTSTDRARAFRNTSAQTVTADGTEVVVQFNGETYDPGNDFDPVTNFNYTVPTSGRYLVTVQAGCAGLVAGTVYRLSIRVNGTIVSSSTNAAAGTDDSFRVTDILDLSAANTIDATMRTASDDFDIGNGSAETWISIIRLL